MSTRRFFAAFLLVALVVAGVASYYASSHPDGLERVAETAGFAGTAEESPAAESPVADYSTKGLENERVSGGVAGVVGSVLVLALAGGLFRLLGRRGSHPEAEPSRHRPGPSLPAATSARGGE